MNYYAARQRQSDGRWDWTCRNDGQMWASGPCAGHTDGHETAEEAERHFYDYEVEHLREATFTTAHRCQAHGEEPPWTAEALDGHQLGIAFLCDEHRNAEGWKQVNPFVPGIAITSSW